MERVTLFYIESPGIKSSQELYFNEAGSLCFDGYDIGKIVEEVWGDSDYEYQYIIIDKEVQKFYPLFNLEAGDRSSLLVAMKQRFSVNNAFSMLGTFMQEHNIQFDSFTWA